MKLPRRLYRKADGSYCEEEELDTGTLVGPAGMEISDQEAERQGIMAYYASKEQKQSGFEDKALAGPPTEPPTAPPEEKGPPPGLHIPEAGRRGGRS